MAKGILTGPADQVNRLLGEQITHRAGSGSVTGVAERQPPVERLLRLA